MTGIPTEHDKTYKEPPYAGSQRRTYSLPRKKRFWFNRQANGLQVFGGVLTVVQAL